jgi:hypothetical protein
MGVPGRLRWNAATNDGAASTPKSRSPSSTSTSVMGKPGPQPRSITLLTRGSVFAHFRTSFTPTFSETHPSRVQEAPQRKKVIIAWFGWARFCRSRAHFLAPQNHPRRSPTIHSFFSYFPVFSSPTTTIEVVGNTGTMSSEKAGVGGSRPSGNSEPVSISSGIKPAYVIGPNSLLRFHLLRSGLSRSQAGLSSFAHTHTLNSLLVDPREFSSECSQRFHSVVARVEATIEAPSGEARRTSVAWYLLSS